MGHKSSMVGEEPQAPALSLPWETGKQVGLWEHQARMGRTESPRAPGPSAQSRWPLILNPRALYNSTELGWNL